MGKRSNKSKKKAANIFKDFTVEIYQRTVRVYYCTAEEYTNAMLNDFGIKVEEDDMYGKIGSHSTVGNDHGEFMDVIWIDVKTHSNPNNFDFWQVLSHEALHAAMTILHMLGIDYDGSKNQEALAYLHDYITLSFRKKFTEK